MKQIILALSCLSLISGNPVLADTIQSSQQRSAQIQWYTNYNQAVQDAQQRRLPLLLFFTGSDWCGWCKKMVQEVFSSPDFVQSAGSSFVFVDIDFPMNKKLPADVAQQNAQLKQKYGITGYPTIVLIGPDQNFIAQTGYRPGGGKAFADHLKQLLNKQ